MCACLLFAEHAYTSKGRSCLPVFANELPPQGSLKNTQSKSLKQSAVGITAFVPEPLCLLLRAPFHPFDSHMCVHLPRHYPFTNPSAPAVAFLQLLTLCTAQHVASARAGWQPSAGMADAVGLLCKCNAQKGRQQQGRGGNPLPHHTNLRQEHASPGKKETAVIPAAIPTPRYLQGRGPKLLHLFLFSTIIEAEIACRSVPGSFKSIVWLVLGPEWNCSWKKSVANADEVTAVGRAGVS